MEMNFCKECNNMLYPKEDRDQRMIFLNCRNCEYVEEASSSILLHRRFHAKDEQIAAPGKDLAKDKTLARTANAKCPKCGGKEAVFMQNHGQEEALRILFVCCFCEFMWTSNKMFGDETSATP